MDITAITKILGPLRRRVRLMVSRAIISAVNDAGGIQVMQLKLLADEVRDGVERFQQYGHTSKPHAGAEAIMVCISGNRDHGVVIAVDDRRFRLKGLEDGEVAIYDDLDQKVHLKRSGILVETPFKFRVDADEIELHSRTKFQFDCNGQGQKWDGNGVETWQDNDTVKPHHPHSPPEIS